jgi:hypothetical protein
MTNINKEEGSLYFAIGKALSDAIASGAEQADYYDAREIDYLVDAVLPHICGTTGIRLEALFNALDERFPDAVDRLASDPPEPKYLKAIDEVLLNAKRYKALCSMGVLDTTFIKYDEEGFARTIDQVIERKSK